MKTPVDKSIIDNAIQSVGIKDFEHITIFEMASVAVMSEKQSGVEFIRMEIGTPGLPSAEIGVNAQIAALQNGVAQYYADIVGTPELKHETSRFIKAFLNVDVSPKGCVPTSGSMQGVYASFLTCMQMKENAHILFIDPGFPVQKMQCDVMGLPYYSFDVYNYRGAEKLEAKLEEYLKNDDVVAIVYSNPNNPTWVCLTEEELQTIGHLADKYDVVVIEDLAYFAMDFRSDLGQPFQPPYQPTVARYTKNYILHISGSKIFSYAGERIAMTCISDALYHREYPLLEKKYKIGEFGFVYVHRVLYVLTSGTGSSCQYALAAMLKASNDGMYDFRNKVAEYGRRATLLKKVFLKNGFKIIYDKDGEDSLADGFYFTIGYEGMTGGELAKKLLYFGVSTYPLLETGSKQNGLRICTSFIKNHHFDLLDERLKNFSKINEE